MVIYLSKKHCVLKGLELNQIVVSKQESRGTAQCESRSKKSAS